MFFFNLSLPEFLTMLAAVSGVVFTLYLLDRARHKQVVATLRFFQVSQSSPDQKHRRKLQQPWSLLLQLLSLALLLLAVAQLRLGSPARASRDHILILDASAFMSSPRLMDQARAMARRYLHALPLGDRVMLVRAGAVASPATTFENDRAALARAIAATQPTAATLNIAQSLEFASQAQRLSGQTPGEIVFIGAGRVPADQLPSGDLPANLRVFLIEGPRENCGIRKMSVRRASTDNASWQIFVAVKNYGDRPRTVDLSLRFGGAPAGARRIVLAAGAEENVTLELRTHAAGVLEARLSPNDAFPSDNRAALELPPQTTLRVSVYSDQAAALRPVFNAIPGVAATFAPIAKYAPDTSAQVVVLDRFSPPSPPKADSIWIAPPTQHSPIAVRAQAEKLKLVRWTTDPVLGTGLRTRDLVLESAQIYRDSPGDIDIAESDFGPMIVARPGSPKIAALGFHPVDSAMKYELATPLLFANILRWMAPGVFRREELSAVSAGTIHVPLDAEPDPATVHVLTENGRPLPYSLDGRSLRFFSESNGVVRVLTGDRELVYSLTLPSAGDVIWKPEHVRQGLPAHFPAEPGSRDVWQILALLAGVGLLTEWILFGRARRQWRKAQ